MVSPLAPRPSSAPGVQLSWHAGDLVAWSPDRGPSRGWPPATGWRQPDHRAQVVGMHVPGETRLVLAQRIDRSALAALSDLDLLQGSVSPSVAWVATVHELAVAAVNAGRIAPRLWSVEPGRYEATWHPLPGDALAFEPDLVASMPPVVAAPAPDQAAAVPAALLALFVDVATRRRLGQRGWLPDLGDVRTPGGRAARLVARALLAEHGAFRADGQLAEPLAVLQRTFEELQWRADGQVVARAQLRLGLPLDDGRWPLRLELVDVDDATRWCPAADALHCTDAALQFAGRPTGLPRIATLADRALHRLGEHAPWLRSWLDECLDEPHADVDVEAAAATLGAIDVLAADGIELVAPDALVRRRPVARGTALPREGGTGRFSAKAVVDWQPVIDGQSVDERVLRRAAEAGAQLVDVGGRWVLLTASDARRALTNLEQHRAEHSEMSPVELLRLAAEVGELARSITEEAEAIVAAGGWLGDLVDGLPDARLQEGAEPAGFAASLRPYQRRALGWLQFLERTGFGGCLADDMGLGKTPTTLAHLAGRPGPHLVVCPLSVVHNWEAEASRFTPLARVAVHHGAGRGRRSIADVAAANDIVLSTYPTVARDIDVLEAIAWSTVVLDEAQAIKNPHTDTARAMRRLPAEQRLALTGTPVENRLSELWSIMAFAVPGLLGTLAQFRTQFAVPIERNADACAAETLRAVTAPFLLRRTKADKSLVPDLPDKVEQIAWATLSHEQAVLYQAVVEELLRNSAAATGMRRRGLVLASLTRLKQICNHPAHVLGDGSALAGRSGKLRRFDELVDQLLEAGERALVFTQFREMGTLLQRHLGERLGLSVPFLHGGVVRSGRQRMVQRFQAGDGAPLLLVSLKAGGTGLNLTAASRVVHYDRWWNPAVEDQATDRAWRIGQQRSVFVHKLVCEGTIEERVDTLINDKRALAGAVVGTTGEAWLSELSTDELRELVVLDPKAGQR